MLGEIRNHPNYFVSEEGDVYRRRKEGLFKLVPDFSNGYARVRLDGKNETIARIVLDVFDPVDDPTLVAFHIDGDHYNDNISNLVWLTPSQAQLYSTYTIQYRKHILRRGAR
jgi:hypothetical protein